MYQFIRRHWPAVFALVLLGVVSLALYMASVATNHQRFVYALDDAYIHMAMARNLAQSGVFGITRHAFSAASSSPLWTLLLAGAFRLCGAHEGIPLLLNFVFAALALVAGYVLLRRAEVSAPLTFVALCGLLFGVPLPVLMFTGLEHSMHVLSAIVALYLSGRLLADEHVSRRSLVVLGAVLALMTAARFEGLFLVVAVAGALAVRRRFGQASFLLATGSLPVLLFGLVALSKGWYALPNSVLIKGNLPDPTSVTGLARFLGFSVYNLAKSPHVVVLLLGAIAAYLQGGRSKRAVPNDVRSMLLLYVIITLLHMQFAKTGWFYRYEAYLVGLGVMVLTLAARAILPAWWAGLSFRNLHPERLAPMVALVIAATPVVFRAGMSLYETVPATANIYEQQYQMGRFIARFYGGRAVAANDIGAIGYLSDVRLLDLWGLADIDVARARRGRLYDTAFIRRIAAERGVQVAVVYDHWYNEFGGLPREWIRVGQLHTRDHVVSSGPTVSFYAVDPTEAGRLRARLLAFSSELPEGASLIGEELASAVRGKVSVRTSRSLASGAVP